MIVTAHQATYLPWAGLFHKIACADVFAVFDVAQYESKSFEARNYIKTQQGPLLLSVPVESSGHLEKIGSEIRIIPGRWTQKHIRSIEMAYSKAPYFIDYFPGLKEIISAGHERLIGLNCDLLRYLFSALGMNVTETYASAYQPVGEKSGLVLDLCRKMGATSYVFGAQGRGYADVPAFEAAGVKAFFQDYQHPVYDQPHGAFAPRMSVIDLLFSHGPRSLDILMSGNASKDHYR